MTRWQVIWLHVTIAITTLTGVVFAWMKYFMKSSDEFAVVNHPLQPYMLDAHVVVAPLLVFVLGWTFSNHMMPKLRFGDDTNRKTGIWLMAIIAPMVVSAYLLEVATNETMRKWMAGAHWVTSAVFVIAYVGHLIRRRAA